MKKGNIFYYLGANPTSDIIVENHEGKILMALRASNVDTCPNMWAFPAGFLNTDAKKGEYFKEGFETSEAAAIRELKEETNLELKDPKLIFIGVFEGNGRDPRDNEESWSKSSVYYYKITEEDLKNSNIQGFDDVQSCKWFTKDEILNMKLAFDHNEIFEQCLKIINGTNLTKKISIK